MKKVSHQSKLKSNIFDNMYIILVNVILTH